MMLAKAAMVMVATVMLTGCIGKNTEERAATGGVRGAVVGGIMGGPVGAIVGASSGAATGTAYSRLREARRHRRAPAQKAEK